jgi:hypothetical protein
MQEDRAGRITLRSPPRAPVWLHVVINGEASFIVTAPHPGTCEPRTRTYPIPGTEQNDYLELCQALARDFGMRPPHPGHDPAADTVNTPATPLLTENASDTILYGYGDPAVLKVDGSYYLVVTSNDAPNAFPILRSSDLSSWEHKGFVFPAGSTPAWAASGPDAGDFWAPELHRVRDGYLLCFAAREHDGSLSIGIARSHRPDGPFTIPDEPLIGGGAIDPHIFVDAEGEALLLWKEDSNDIWPSLLVGLLHECAELIASLFPADEDMRLASFAATLWPWLRELPPMQCFFFLQPLIAATVANFARVRERLTQLGGEQIAAILEAMATPIFAQPLSADGSRLTGERTVLLTNDMEWEGHLIEGPWLTRQDGLHYLFYAGNDFSTTDYGVGVAAAERALGPYRKAEVPLIRSTADWTGPGHPSIATGPGGKPHIFYHAFFPGRAGYKAFRALITAPLRFADGVVEIGG